MLQLFVCCCHDRVIGQACLLVASIRIKKHRALETDIAGSPKESHTLILSQLSLCENLYSLPYLLLSLTSSPLSPPPRLPVGTSLHSGDKSRKYF